MSHETKVDKVTSGQDIPDIADTYKDSLEAIKKYENCITTTIYGESYLDPEKCKARDFDLDEESKEQMKRLLLSTEWIKKRTEEIGWEAQLEECLSKMPLQFNDENLNFDSGSDFPINEQSINEVDDLIEALHLVDHKIKLVNGPYVKVVAVIMNAEEVLLGVEEEIGNILDYYEISYKNDLIDFKAKVMEVPEMPETTSFNFQDPHAHLF